jgi:segregation and condensation protein A
MDKPAEPVHQIKKWNVTIDEQMEYVNSKLREKPEMSFLELLIDLNDRIKIVVTFIAMLEMVKAGTVGLRESNAFNDFIIYTVNNG